MDIRYCHEQGARVINLSIGDADTRYRGACATAVAGLLDQLARELDLVMVVPTGNVVPGDYAPFEEAIVDSYPTALLDAEHTSMLDPRPCRSRHHGWRYLLGSARRIDLIHRGRR